MGDGRVEGSSAIGDGGQAAISLTPDVDGTRVRIFESLQLEGWFVCRGLTVFAHSSGGWKSAIKVAAWPHSSKGSRGGFFLASSIFWWLPVILGTPWLVDTSLQCPLPSSRGRLPSVCL